jgi:hypothetical protein
VLKVRKNTVEAQSSWFGLFSNSVHKFYSYSFGQTYLQKRSLDSEDLDKVFAFALWILEDESVVNMERNVVTFWDICSEIGGLVEILTMSSIFLVTSY